MVFMHWDLILASYVIDGAIGGLAYAMVSKMGYDKKFEIVRRIIGGGIVGMTMYFAGMPNSLTAIGLGYMGLDVLEAIMVKKKMMLDDKTLKL